MVYATEFVRNVDMQITINNNKNNDKSKPV